jgi:hypothetical protein
MGPQTSPSIFIMTRNKTGAFLSMGRIPQLFGHAVLATGMLAGAVSVLNAGGAQAAPTFDCDGITPPINPKGFNYDGIAYSTPVPVPSCISPLAGIANQVNVDHDYAAPQPFNTSGYAYYKLSNRASENFIRANIDADIDGIGSYSFTFDKYVFKTEADFLSGNNNLATNFNFKNINGNISVTPPGGGDLLGYTSTIWVKDSWTISGNAEVDNITNTFQTPGPLPILGAGAAFGFSRKLRGRIKAARLG